MAEFEVKKYNRDANKTKWCVVVTNKYEFSSEINDFFDPFNNRYVTIKGKRAFKFASKEKAEEMILLATLKFS